MRRLYFRYSPPWVTDDGHPVRRALMVTADPPGTSRLWINARDWRRVARLLRGDDGAPADAADYMEWGGRCPVCAKHADLAHSVFADSPQAGDKETA